MVAFDRIISHSVTVNSRTRAVIGMSFSAALSLSWWPSPNTPMTPEQLATRTDVWSLKLRDVYAAGIVAAAAAGNGALGSAAFRALDTQAPARSGGRSNPLIVVGNSDYDNTRYQTSKYEDPSGKGILTIYAVGVDVVCGTYVTGADNTPTAQNAFKLLTDGESGNQQGTSQATAQTVGIIANMLVDPNLRTQLMAGGATNLAMAVKTMLISMGFANKGLFTQGAITDGIPRLTSNVLVNCPAGVAAVSGRPNPPNVGGVPPFTQVGLTPTTTEVASGTAVTFPHPVSVPSDS